LINKIGQTVSSVGKTQEPDKISPRPPPVDISNEEERPKKKRRPPTCSLCHRTKTGKHVCSASDECVDFATCPTRYIQGHPDEKTRLQQENKKRRQEKKEESQKSQDEQKQVNSFGIWY